MKGRPDAKKIQESLSNYPKQTRESLIRTQIQKEFYSADGSFESAVNTAMSFTDRRFIENQKQKTMNEKHPHGQSFDAIAKFQLRFSAEDPFLLYEYEEDIRKLPFVLKSSRRKVQLLSFLDKDGEHRLANEVVLLDVLHSRVRQWKTYTTLSYYDTVLRQLVRLVTMEAMKESHEYCQLFFTKINEMLTDLARDSNPLAPIVIFNPFHLKDDEHGGNKIGMATVYGKDFVKNRTSSCEYHFNLSVKNHIKNVRQNDRKQYSKICHAMKEAILKEIYATRKEELKSLISRQMMQTV